MRTANDGRGEEPWEDHPTPAPSPDDEATRVFSREALTPAPGTDGADGTREFSRDPDDEATRRFRRGEFPAPPPPDPDQTSEFTRDADTRDASGGTPFTRRFVRDRPPGRGRAPRPPAPDLPEEAPGPEPPGTRPEPPRPSRRRRRRFRLRWLVTLLLVTALALPPATWGWVWYTARQDDRVPSDAIVVLGASQYNGVPSPVFEARLRHAQVLYLEGVAPVIVTVGGKQPADNFTEAASGRDWLVEVGVPADQIIAVEEGRDTLQSIQAVSLVFEERSWDSAILVSDPWHSLRSERMAADHGIEAGTSPSRSGPAVIERRTQLWYITRETAALWYYWIFDDSSDIDVNAA
ncbi:YdcF family protein [Nocardiopsis quinghaiensis]|uniref:YdcF family protein n=1 Tax=Nocardiopsis quinghaiensis TaxID=464995 RepID=UPI00123974D5|nr:YdcF family protein [Nocardiopsis quinghaiensis]